MDYSNGEWIMTYKTATITVENNIAHVSLCRPDELNTMNADFWLEIPAIFDEIDANPDVRVVVLSSTGKHFSAGLDLKMAAGFMSGDMSDPARYAESLRRMVLGLQHAFNAMEACRKPVLVAVHGGCIGGGVDMISACDCRYATKDAYFTVKEVDLGIVADVGTLQRLPKIIHEGLARELAYTGRKLSGEEAKTCGLVNEVFDTHEALIEGVMAVAKVIASHSPLALAGSKEMLNYSRDHTVPDALNYVATWQAGMLCNLDIQSSIMASMQKITPEYASLSKKISFGDEQA